MGRELKVNVVVPEAEFCHELLGVFKDAILVDDSMDMIFVSGNLLDRLEFTQEEVRGKGVNYLTRDFNLKRSLQQDLLTGDIQDKYVPFYSKSNLSILMVVTGFKAAVVGRSKDYYKIIRVSEVPHLERVDHEIETKRAELDQFIYRTAHDLRGPIATIRGLINLQRIRPDEFTTPQFADLVGQYAEDLDQKLCKLLYLAESGQESVTPSFKLRLRDIEEAVRFSVESHALGSRTQLHVVAFDDKVEGINELQTFSLLDNLMLFILHLPPVLADDNRIVIFLSSSPEGLELKIMAKGVEIDDRLAMVIQHRQNGYGQMLRHPELINYFAAQKIAVRIRASIRLRVSRNNELEINAWIPSQ
jgi:hypothetical protein